MAMKEVTIQKIARQLGVHHSTVSRALNSRPGSSPALRRKILKLAGELGYASPRRRRAVAVVLRLDEVGMDLYSYTLLYFLSRAINAAGYRIEILYENDLELLDDRLVDAGVSLLPINHIARYWSRSRALPLVCVNDYSDRLGGVRAVSSDDRQAVRFAVAELHRAGHRRIAYTSLIDTTLNADARRRYFAEAMAATPGAGPAVILSDDDAGRIAAQLPPEVTAVICGSEMLGEELFRAFQAAGRLEPSAFVSWVMPDRYWHRDAGVATVTQDYAGLAQNAVEMLAATFAGTPPPDDRLVACEVRPAKV